MHPYSHAHAHHTHMRPTDHQQFTSDFMLGEEHQTSEKQIESSRRAAGRGDGDGRRAVGRDEWRWAAGRRGQAAMGRGPGARRRDRATADCACASQSWGAGLPVAGVAPPAQSPRRSVPGLAWLGLGLVECNGGWLRACGVC
jgi:hypothetical protein